jgi:anti-anti-sigma factor
VEIRKQSLAGVPLLEIEDDIDHSWADVFDRAIRESLQGQDRLVLDLTRCGYLDSGGLAVVLTTAKRLRANGWVGVIGCNRNVLRLLQIVGLTTDPAVRIFPGLQEAFDALAMESA